MTRDVCIHFAGRGMAKVKLTSSERLSLQTPKTKTAVTWPRTRERKRSLQERTTGLSLLTHGHFSRILLLGSKQRWQETVLKPAFKKKKSFKIAVQAPDAAESSWLPQPDSSLSRLWLVLTISIFRRGKRTFEKKTESSTQWTACQPAVPQKGSCFHISAC